MATIRQRGDRTWQIQAYLGRDRDSRRRFATRTVHGTKADARRAATALQAEVDAGKVRATDDLTFAELVDRWVATRSPSWSPGYRYKALHVLERHALPTLGPLQVTKVRPGDLDALYTRLRRRGVGASTVATLHARIRAALGQAVRWDIIATNPAQRIDAPTEPRSKAQAAPPDAVATALLAATETDLLAFIWLSATTGARPGEICALRWEDLDLDRGEVTIARAISDGGPGVGLVVKDTKTGRPRRLALDEGTIRVLRAWKAEHGATDLADGVRSPWVFPAALDRGRPARPDRMSKRWRTLRDEAGVGPLRLYDLRHGAATGGMEAGYGPVDVGGRVGHSRPSTTSDRYGHHSPARDRQLADALGARLDQAIEKARAKKRTG